MTIFGMMKIQILTEHDNTVYIASYALSEFNGRK